MMCFALSGCLLAAASKEEERQGRKGAAETDSWNWQKVFILLEILLCHTPQEVLVEVDV